MVELEKVSLTLGNRKILDNVSFHINPGEIVLLSGDSGVGKSTILKLILGLIRPTAGKIHVLGHDIGALKTNALMRVRQQCGIVFQEGALFDSLTVEENVSFFLKEALHVPPDEIRKRVSETLSYLGLMDYLHYLPSQLSGGMKKRVAIARAIVTRPKLLLYDEPTAGLDARSAIRVVELIRDLQKQFNVTSLIVTHELHYFVRVIDKIFHLENGRIEFEKYNVAALSALRENNFLNLFAQE
ncbi:ABC transporter ATP-binding protein [Calditrichota bacterium LG25]